jgi:nitroimidazol reductase NimA-like FMN-containing flavoprotein (pyridoxamine 5'-phosphate oxidase superfamily)
MAGSTLRSLTRQECLELLSSVSLGRVAVSIGALPAIRTVRFALTADHVVFKTAGESRLRRAANNAVVAFHADHCEEELRRGWCVLVQGLGEEVTAPAGVEALRSLPLERWSPDDEVFVRISLSHVTGERATW